MISKPMTSLLRSSKPLRWMLAAIMATCTSAVLAQSSYPSRPIKIIVPFTPGGGVDAMARSLGNALSQRLGQSFIIENRPGAGTIIGNRAVAQAAPDGYTLLMASSSFTTGPSLAKALPYSIDKDFSAVAMVANVPAVLVVNPRMEAATVPQLIDSAKLKPGVLTSATYGTGSTPHLISELFQQMTGTKFLSVPYSGGGPAILSTMSGETNMVFPSVLPALSHIRSGQLRALAIASTKRSALLPDVKTFEEQGVPLVSGTWFGVLAPAGTPAAIVQRLNTEIAALSQDESFVQKLNDEGAEFVGGTASDFSEFLKTDQARWKKLIIDVGIKAD